MGPDISPRAWPARLAGAGQRLTATPERFWGNAIRPTVPRRTGAHAGSVGSPPPPPLTAIRAWRGGYPLGPSLCPRRSHWRETTAERRHPLPKDRRGSPVGRGMSWAEHVGCTGAAWHGGWLTLRSLLAG